MPKPRPPCALVHTRWGLFVDLFGQHPHCLIIHGATSSSAHIPFFSLILVQLAWIPWNGDDLFLTPITCFWCQEQPFDGPSFFFGGGNSFLVVLSDNGGWLIILDNNHVINLNNLLIYPWYYATLMGLWGPSSHVYRPLMGFLGYALRYVIDELMSPCHRQGITTCLTGWGPSAKGEHWLC